MADYHSLLMRAVANLPNAGTLATRGAIYGRARKALLEQLRSLRPPLPESDITREEKALDAAIAEIEGRYGSEQGAEPSASPAAAAPTPTSPPAGKPGPAPAPSPKVAPPPAPAQAPAAQRPSPAAASAPSASPTRSPSQAGSPSPSGPTQSAAVQAAAAQRPQPPTQGRTQPPAGPPPQAPTAPAGKPAAVASAAAASPARSQLAAAMGSSPGGRAAPSVVARGGRDEGLPGVTALDPARAVRPPNRADNGHEFRRAARGCDPSRRTGAGGRRARSRGRDGPARPSLPARCGDPAPGRAGRRRRQAETVAMDRGGGSSWRRPCGRGSRDPDAPEAAGPRHQAARRGAAACPAAALGEDRRTRRTDPAPISRASSSGERIANGPTERSGRDASDPGARSGEPARSAVAVSRPSGYAGRRGRQSAEAGRELRLDDVVPDSSGAGSASDGRGEG